MAFTLDLWPGYRVLMKACYLPLLGSEERLIFAHNWIVKAAGNKHHGDMVIFTLALESLLPLSFREYLFAGKTGENCSCWELWSDIVRVTSGLCAPWPAQAWCLTDPSAWVEGDQSFLSTFPILSQSSWDVSVLVGQVWWTEYLRWWKPKPNPKTNNKQI